MSLKPPVLDFTDAANLICLLPFFLLPLALSSFACCSSSSLSRRCSCSKAIWISDFYWGASCEIGSKTWELKSNWVLMPDRFLRTNFCDKDLLIWQFVKLMI